MRDVKTAVRLTSLHAKSLANANLYPGIGPVSGQGDKRQTLLQSPSFGPHAPASNLESHRGF